MKCKNCGANVAEDMHSCPNCGEVCSSTGYKGRTKKRTNIYFILTILVLAALLVFAIYCTVSQVVANEGAVLLTPEYTLGSSLSTQSSTPTQTTVPVLESENPPISTTQDDVDATDVDTSDSLPAETQEKTQVEETIIGTPPSEVTASTPIMGKSTVTAQDLVDFYEKYSPIDYPTFYEERGVSLNTLAKIYIDECEVENVRADLAFAQMAHDTGFLRFGGKVKIEQLNFAGLGTSAQSPGINFATLYGDNSWGIQMGIRAQIQHLKAYGSIDQLIEENVDPLFSKVKRASALTIGDLSNNVSEDANYSTAILRYINHMS